MHELKKVSQVVKAVLEADERARNSDHYLYLKVLQIMAEPKGININEMPVAVFLLRCNSMLLPPFETVRRTRQKTQEKYPELAASEKVRGHRKANEETFRAYARDEL